MDNVSSGHCVCLHTEHCSVNTIYVIDQADLTISNQNI